MVPREVHCIPQTVIVRYRDMPFARPHVNMYMSDTHGPRLTNPHQRMHFLSGQEVCPKTQNRLSETQDIQNPKCLCSLVSFDQLDGIVLEIK